MPKQSSSLFCIRSIIFGATLTLSCMAVGKYFLAPLFIDYTQSRLGNTTAHIQDSLSTHSLQQPSPGELTLAAAEAMIAVLNDPYAEFINDEALTEFKEGSTGMHIGIGVVLTSGSQIIFPKPNSDAVSQGLSPGDTILSINQHATAGLSQEQLQKLLRGKPGTKVNLSILRLDGSKYSCSVKRERVPSLTVTDERIIEPSQGIAHLSVKSFARSTPAELKAALGRLEAKGMTKLILDLRSNLGGQLNDAIQVASYFLEGQVVCHLHPQHGETVPKLADLQLSLYPDLPLLILVDQYSASGAEVVAAAMRDHQRAELMGLNTYGKGVFQKVLSFRDPDFAVKFSAGHYLSPDGHSIEQEGGLIPDIVLQPLSADALSAIKQWNSRVRIPHKYQAIVNELFPDYAELPPPEDEWLDAAVNYFSNHGTK
ncbi:MAG: S41 family peptidase [Planctomycetota bacterium]|nr:S41 family peptidase [Planctomycetota bacterium]